MNIGLTGEEAHARLVTYGRNEIGSKRRFTGLTEFLLRFKNPLVFILFIAASISAFLGDEVSAVIISVIVVLSVAVDFFNTYKSEKAAEALRERVRITATVVRDGVFGELPLAEIVPGDVVNLTPGDIIPADGEILEARDFFVNESSLTGESFPVEKRSKDSAMMGCSVVSGVGQMVIVTTGKGTKFGKIAEALGAREIPTEFERGIKDFSYLIMKVTFSLVIFIFLVNALHRGNILESFLFAAALAVGLTPELLPMIIALNLSKGATIMAKHGVIVKKLSAIQNFGSMDVFCTDKTGTLTKDKIVLVRSVDGKGEDSEEVFRHAYVSSNYHSGFVSPLDTAIKEHKTLDMSAYKKIDEIPFDFLRRRESIVMETGEGGVLIAKGAAEDIMAISTAYGPDGAPFDESLRAGAHAVYKELSGKGFRVLGICTRRLAEVKEVYTKNDESEMTFLGFMAFFDPPKVTAEETLKKMHAYGVQVKIITGDNEFVTMHIAETIHLPVEGVLTGAEIQEMTESALRARVEKTTIFARITPDQKMHIIEALRANGHVVGYLGDGINDAPALKAADVGISVNNAVDVAKESADLILMNKSLGDLIDGIIEGRKIFSNTLKYLMMSLSSNFGNMFSMAGASLFLPFLPMLPTQILLNNLLYDTSQFAIPTDTVDDADVEKPRKLHIGFIKKFMFVFGPLSSLFDLATFLMLFYLFKLTDAGFQTGWFLESIATQALVVYVIRTRKIPFLESMPGRYLMLSSIAVIVIAAFVVFSPLGGFFKFSALSLPVLIGIVLIVIAYLVAVEMVKRWFYRSISPDGVN